MSTAKLFYEDSYLKEAEAIVVKVDGEKVWLDKTIFFAFSGGQASDNGTINAQFIKDLQKEGNDIIHFIEKPEFKKGDKVLLVLDWGRRYNLMRLHSAAHIVYLVLRKIIGEKKLIGSNIHTDKARIDYNLEDSIGEHLPEAERKTNELIDAGLAIKTWEDQEKKGKFWWQLDIDEKEGSQEFGEKLPCGGTHPKNTKEIGHIRLKRKNLGAGKERVEITLSL
ncbi:MAG: alanyl-tRNA editing protein [Nanoarchaeota archaeon]|nr:alanyl-tRNA editing protein [Nanoarchaeota archaeon]MBU1135490.1 alanyl-tRNA editing protein [Nanoarchaeota archaeon]